MITKLSGLSEYADKIGILYVQLILIRCTRRCLLLTVSAGAELDLHQTGDLRFTSVITHISNTLRSPAASVTLTMYCFSLYEYLHAIVFRAPFDWRRPCSSISKVRLRRSRYSSLFQCSTNIQITTFTALRYFLITDSYFASFGVARVPFHKPFFAFGNFSVRHFRLDKFINFAVRIWWGSLLLFSLDYYLSANVNLNGKYNLYLNIALHQ